MCIRDSHRTAVGYESLKQRITDELGHYYLDKITPRQIKAFVAKLGQPGANMITKKPLSPKTQRNYLSLLDVYKRQPLPVTQDGQTCNLLPLVVDDLLHGKVVITLEFAIVLLDVRCV